MTKIHKLTYNIKNINEVARQLIELLPFVSIFTFTGPLGAGKTTLISAMLHQAGINADIVSPTFTYLNTYTNTKGQTFYHFDLYRIKSKADFLAAGFEEYLYQPNSWALIEWPEEILSLISKRACHIKIDYQDNQRILHYSINP